MKGTMTPYGTVNRGPARDAKRAAYRQQTDALQTREDWLHPTIILGVCSVIFILIGLPDLPSYRKRAR